MLRWIPKILDRVFVVAGALFFSQAPMYMQQYQQQLIGRVAELQWQVDSMRHAADRSNRSLEQYVHKFMTSEDIDFSQQGEIMNSTVERWRSLSFSLNAFQQASIVTRPFVFVANLNYDIAISTLQHFEMGIAFTTEGLIYGLLGMFIGFLIFAIISKVFFAFYILINNLFSPVTKKTLTRR